MKTAALEKLEKELNLDLDPTADINIITCEI